MSVIAIVTLPLAGHVRPMMAAARALTQAGRRPVIIGPPDLTAKIPRDIEVLTVGTSDMPPGSLDAQCEGLARMRSWPDFISLFKTVAALSQFYIDHLPAAVEALGATAILHDQLEPGAGIVARGLSRTLGVHHISLACALPMNREASVPPPIMGWRYRPTAFGEWLNAGYYRVVNALLKEQSRALQTGAERFGLSKPVGLLDWQQPWTVDDGISHQLDIAQGYASLDYPRERPPHYVGPLRDQVSGYPGLESIASERDGRPLAFISLGTLMGGRTQVLTALAKAALSRNLQPVVVHGGRWANAAERLPKGAIVRPFLDQADILSQSDVAIIHGGYNSTNDAVARGVPLIIVPQAFEQGAIAARVERANLGRTVSGFGPSLSQRAGLALGDVLQSETITRAVRRTQFEALAAPGLSGLIAEIDRLMGQASRHVPDYEPLLELPVNRHQAHGLTAGRPAE